ncbi:hypothetical protein [Bizionia myxarmorum]|uniref:Uncharacterized protein n=1 Tax=Bizionia myxarmorum TaxID=291186 RepID=A0A5D0RAG3_9FLAO|nr:hypothetical protein [Bizionia myxarmorum]TYB78343.1 hypothetical protein ES674_00755 [Bizionia myxarmorum]
MLSLLTLNNLKTVLIMVGIGLAIYFYQDYSYQKKENARQTDNLIQIRKQDSLKYAKQVYTKKEIEEYLQYSRQDLQQFLEANKIKINRIEQIITQTLKYTDTTKRTVDLSPVLEAIKSQRNIKIPVIDSTECLIVKGFIIFKNDTLSLDITDRQFKNASDVISYWERRQWKFLGIKTRLFGKKQATVIIKDSCGKTQTFVIDKRKK